ncbi:unnamed protein product [Pleuronectes platessa]|uniref:Uncharacterized protein n=1 Tax=Pleuronectes platessa TaxID=8262 RepID=A0A9N7ZDI1_PLEPL|nr:unnamed protein product [Pleuronectes platessa]
MLIDAPDPSLADQCNKTPAVQRRHKDRSRNYDRTKAVRHFSKTIVQHPSPAERVLPAAVTMPENAESHSVHLPTNRTCTIEITNVSAHYCLVNPK